MSRYRWQQHNPGTPNLAGQQPIFLLPAMAEYHRGYRSPPALQAMLRRADVVELDSLKLYHKP